MIKMMTALLGLVLLAPFIVLPGMAQTAGQQEPAAQQPQATGQPSQPSQQQPTEPSQQQPAPRKQPQWKSREEYDAFTAMVTEKDPKKKISLAEAVLQKFPQSDFKDAAYTTEMGAYHQLGESAKAIDAGHKAVEANPDNLDALTYLSFTFPFVFKPADAKAKEMEARLGKPLLDEERARLRTEEAGELATAETNGKKGLELIAKLQKPASVTDEQFNTFVKGKRAFFNGVVGFVALQRKDYAGSISSLKAAAEDNPSDFYSFYRMGLAYFFSNPRDYDHAVWYMARAVSLAKAAKDPNGEAFEKYLKQTYVGYHGNDQGLAEILSQAAGSVSPPEGFKVAAMETPKPTGNKNIDDFNELTFPLKLGGERAQKQWDALKGQPLGLGGFVNSVKKGIDPGSYVVRVALDKSKASSGYDIEIKDTTQPKVGELSQGDLVRFEGTITAYTATPTLVLTLDGKINDEDLAAALANKPKSKPKPTRKPSTTHKRAARTQS